MSVQIDPQVVIQRLSQQVGAMAAELAMRDAALEAADARIAELEAAQPRSTEEAGEA